MDLEEATGPPAQRTHQPEPSVQNKAWDQMETKPMAGPTTHGR